MFDMLLERKVSIQTLTNQTQLQTRKKTLSMLDMPQFQVSSDMKQKAE